jgi:hypothetical protein
MQIFVKTLTGKTSKSSEPIILALLPSVRRGRSGVLIALSDVLASTSHPRG